MRQPKIGDRCEHAQFNQKTMRNERTCPVRHLSGTPPVRYATWTTRGADAEQANRTPVLEACSGLRGADSAEAEDQKTECGAGGAIVSPQEKTPDERGAQAYREGCKEWDNPYHPSLEAEKSREWLEGFLLERDGDNEEWYP